ncbi:Alkyldihydroxyacetonephosphate synthase [Parelaphostrongylus tenuis]|uniref:Alkylglycerone-phosphate synthase n=1 Tax=Parelaphostrongylus tenuis TaxID=148309 RepID=A0AAD5R179_PARTN|nr:Alkyldihydroxyacetonephosphate synthase [Parelaphostrongylus tenuis]
MEFGVLGESFETSVPWDKISQNRSGHSSYDAGACVYFYFGFNTRGLHNGLEVYDKIETAARDEIIACGGSISHHHGIGKLRKQWMLTTQGVVGIALVESHKDGTRSSKHLRQRQSGRHYRIHRTANCDNSIIHFKQ